MRGEPRKTVEGCEQEEQTPRGTTLTEANMENNGRPFLVQYVKNFGACPRSARPYRIRDAQNRKLFPAEIALVKIPALMICGKTNSNHREPFKLHDTSTVSRYKHTFDTGTRYCDDKGRLGSIPGTPE